EDRQPGQPGLIDLEHEPLEQLVIVTKRKAIFAIVIRPVKWMAGGNVAVGHVGDFVTQDGVIPSAAEREEPPAGERRSPEVRDSCLLVHWPQRLSCVNDRPS